MSFPATFFFVAAFLGAVPVPLIWLNSGMVPVGAQAPIRLSSALPLSFKADYRATIPVIGLLALAYNRFSIRPASNANRPAITACFIASAIFTASSASAIAVFMRIAS